MLVLATRTDAQPVALNAAPLIVANSAGLHALDQDGKLLRTLTKTPGEQPRFMAGQKDVLFLRALDDTSFELRKISLALGQEESLVKLPKFRYSQFHRKIEGTGDSDGDVALRVYSDEGLQVGPTAACLYLTNGNSNMADLEVDLRLDLATKKIQTLRKGCSGSSCQNGLTFVGHPDLNCQTGETPTTSVPPKKTYPFFVKDQRLMSRAANGATKTLAELKSRSGWGWDEAGASSSSLRYTTLQGNLEMESDSLIRQVLLLDRQSGNIYPVSTPDPQTLGQSVPWPKPLTRAQLSHIGDSAKLGTLSIGAGSTIRAIGAGDRMLIDQLLLVPGKAIVYLSGDVAF